MPVNAYAAAQLIHILAATIWIGGHLIIATIYLPRLHRGDHRSLQQFEEGYERIAIPALLVAALTGLYMGLQWAPLTEWFTFKGKPGILGVKATLFTATLLLSLDARLRIIEKARKRGSIPVLDLTLHILGVTAIAIGFLVAGWALRFT